MADPPPETVLCAEGPRGVVAYCGGCNAGGVGHVSTLYVLASAQGMGLGRRLLVSMARVLSGRGGASLRLWVLDGNDRARAFYEHLGAQKGEGRPVTGWGGRHQETAFDWPDIHALADLAVPPPA
jgi:ribosomal protein S18 acetylase RimI-like enzyme